jgi:hypothetical protein
MQPYTIFFKRQLEELKNKKKEKTWRYSKEEIQILKESLISYPNFGLKKISKIIISEKKIDRSFDSVRIKLRRIRRGQKN